MQRPPTTYTAGSEDSNSAGLSPTDIAMLQLAGRIRRVVEEEARVLAGASAEELDPFIERKNHLALEAARFTQHAADYVPASPARLELQAAAAALSQNSDLIRRHMHAVGEITSLIAGIYSQATSDGTYTSETIRPGRKP